MELTPEIKKEMKAVLEEGLTEFTTDPFRRCVATNFLCYYDPVRAGKEGISKGCFIGMFMTPEQKKMAMGPVDCLPARLLPTRMQGMPTTFLLHLQKLHDNSEYWTSVGLSPKGHQKVSEIKYYYGLER